MIANVDRTVIGENAGLEIKTPAFLSIKNGKAMKFRMLIIASVCIIWQ